MKIIKDFANAFGPSGRENDVLDVAKKYLKNNLKIKSNSLKNLYINFPEGNNKPVVLLDAHSDELGLMVSSVRKNGLLNVTQLGGWNITSLPGQEFVILNNEKKYIKGLIGAIPPHFQQGDRSQVKVDELFLDIGATSDQEVSEDFKIREGHFAVPNVSCFQSGNKLFGKAFDNRIGCALVTELCNDFSDDNLPVHVAGQLVSQEEIGGRGVLASLREHQIKPALALVFEGTPADDSWKTDVEIQGALDKGAQIRIKDRSMVTNPELVDFTLEVAKRTDLPYQLAVRSGGGTNAGTLHSFGDIPSLVLGVPVRYAHTPQGIISLSDYENTKKLAIEIIKALDQENLAFWNGM